MIRVCIVLLIATIGLGSALLYEKAQRRIQLQDATITSLQEKNQTITVSLDAEREWAKSRESVIAALVKIGEDVKMMQDQITVQDQENRKALKELIANDKQVRDYMALSVPTALGMRYERKATTDPTQYGPGGSVRPNPVPIPKSGGTKK